MMVSVAQFEREMMKERQVEGIKRAQAEGKYKGRVAYRHEASRQGEGSWLMLVYPEFRCRSSLVSVKPATTAA